VERAPDLAHLTDTEIVHHYRTRMILSEPGCKIIAFDENKWAKTLAYTQRDMLLMRRTFTTSRESIIELGRFPSGAIFGRSGTHSEIGELRALGRGRQGRDAHMHHYDSSWRSKKGRHGFPPAPRPP